MANTKVIYAGGDKGIDYQNALNTFGGMAGVEVRKYDPATTKFNAGDMVFGTPEATDVGDATLYRGAHRDETASMMQRVKDNMIQTPAAPVYDTSMLTGMLANIDSAGQARLAQLKEARDTTIQGYQRAGEKAKPEYQQARNDTNYQSKLAGDRADEMAARGGLYESGKNASDQIDIETNRINSLTSLSTQERAFLEDIDWKIGRLQEEGVAADDAVLKDLQTQKDQLTMQVMDRIQAQQNADRDFNYTIGRDSILDKRYEDDTTYNRGRDAVSDARYEDETSYNRSQDAFDNGLKLKQLDIERYKAYKSKADDEALTEDDVKSEAYVQFYKALDDGKAYVWLTENRDYILRTFSNGASVYNDMMKTFQEKAKDPTYPKAPDPLKLAPHLPG